MRTLLAFLILLAPGAYAQTAPAPTPAQVQAEVSQAMSGEWTGVLEYRDYSEPATSTKRVQLPTWLSIKRMGSGLSEHFVYDDGPNKTVDSTQTVAVDVAAGTYSETPEGKAAQVFKVAGYDKLKTGRGELVLLGAGMDSSKPAEVRITLAIRRNLLTWLEEVRPAGSAEPFVFRHRYTFTRAQVPQVSAQK